MAMDEFSEAARLERQVAAVRERPNAVASDELIINALRGLHQQGLDRLPLPGGGHTLERWQRLAQLAGCDLALAKLYESHADALAILAECDALGDAGDGLWAVWAAEPPGARVQISARRGAEVRLDGRKAWCSAAQQVDHAVLTAWDEQGQPQLVSIRLDGVGQRLIGEQWQAVGMAATCTADLDLSDCPGRLVGQPGQYVDRPGFWQGAVGVAACWYGAAAALAEYLRSHCQSPKADPHALAHLGATDAALAGARAVLRASAQWIDAAPQADASAIARQARAQVEQAVQQVIEHVGRALGAAPFCRNRHFARLAADLPVFIRQSHAERDLAQLGHVVATGQGQGWAL